jgi:hypothetical protein
MDYDSAANSDAGAGRPPVLADPARRVEGLVVDALAFADDELTDGELPHLLLPLFLLLLPQGSPSLSSFHAFILFPASCSGAQRGGPVDPSGNEADAQQREVALVLPVRAPYGKIH